MGFFTRQEKKLTHLPTADHIVAKGTCLSLSLYFPPNNGSSSSEPGNCMCDKDSHSVNELL